MRSSKKTSDLQHVKKLDENDISGAYSHEINTMRKKDPAGNGTNSTAQKYKNLWYMKEFTQTAKAKAVLEVLAQEFFRLFLPYQPKTRLVVDEVENKFFILSKEVSGYVSLSSLDKELIRENIKNNIYQGLGAILVLSLFVNEVDLKLDNLCLDEHNHIIKLDGDACFIEIQKIKYFEYDNFNITTKVIDALPFPSPDIYGAHNWLDVLMRKNINHYPLTIDQTISNQSKFREEVNETILKILLVPDSLIKKFVEFYYPDNGTLPIYDEIINRRNQLQSAALQNQHFINYASQQNPENCLLDYISYLREFKTTSKNYLVNEDIKMVFATRMKDLQKNMPTIREEQKDGNGFSAENKKNVEISAPTHQKIISMLESYKNSRSELLESREKDLNLRNRNIDDPKLIEGNIENAVLLINSICDISNQDKLLEFVDQFNKFDKDLMQKYQKDKANKEGASAFEMCLNKIIKLINEDVEAAAQNHIANKMNKS